jgi:hypothetical protein
MKRLTLTAGIASLLLLGTARLPVEWAKAQGEFLTMDRAFRAIVNTPAKTWSSDSKSVDGIMTAFEERRASFFRKVAEVRAGVEGRDEARLLKRLDADLRAYRAITDAPDDATNAKLAPVANAVNGDFDALESISDTTEKPIGDSHPHVWIIAAALCLSAALLTALSVLFVRRKIRRKADDDTETPASSYLSAGSLDIINRLSAATSGYGTVEPARSPEPELEPELEPEPEPVAPLETISEEPERPQIDATINEFTQHTQQLISALFSLNTVADSTMSLVGTLADALEKSPDRREIELVATELQMLTSAMLTTVQQLSTSTIRMQSQVIHMMKVHEHI